VELEKTGSGSSAWDEGLEVEAIKAEGQKCGRCWRYSDTTGSNKAHPELCSRCAENV
jgi:isoleucyl-tRNA synthetase